MASAFCFLYPPAKRILRSRRQVRNARVTCEIVARIRYSYLLQQLSNTKYKNNYLAMSNIATQINQ